MATYKVLYSISGITEGHGWRAEWREQHYATAAPRARDAQFLWVLVLDASERQLDAPSFDYDVDESHWHQILEPYIRKAITPAMPPPAE